MQTQFARACALSLGLAACTAISQNRAGAAESTDWLSKTISPVVNPILFESPFIDSEVRPIFLTQKMPGNFITGGGNVRVYAVQLRYAITDRLALIATKDGFIEFNPSGMAHQDGWANLAGGLKYAIIDDRENDFILTPGVTFEFPTGNQRVFQGYGDGLLNPFVSAAKGFDDVHLQAYAGPRIAISGEDSSFFDASLHVDYQLWNLYPLAEFNWVYVYDAGRRIPLTKEGFDLVDFGSSEAEEESVVTTALGLRYRVTDDIDLGVTGEFPLTSDSGIFGWRVTTDLIWRPMGWNALFN